MSTCYSMTDTNAPQSPAASNSNYYGNIYFRDVLMACLVDGYSGQSAAGWTVVYDDSSDTSAIRFALANANGDVVEFVGTSNNGFAVFLWDSITTPGSGTEMSEGTGKAKMSGFSDPDLTDGNCTGIYTKDFAYVCHSTYDYRFSWVMIADEYTFVLNSIYCAFYGLTNARNDNCSPLYVGAVRSPYRDVNVKGNFHFWNVVRDIGSLSSGPSSPGDLFFSEREYFSSLLTSGGAAYNGDNHWWYGDYYSLSDDYRWTASDQPNFYSYLQMQPVFLRFSGPDSNCPGFSGETTQSQRYSELFGKFRFIATPGSTYGGAAYDYWLFRTLSHTQWADPMDIFSDGYDWFWSRHDSSSSSSIPYLSFTNHPDFD